MAEEEYNGTCPSDENIVDHFQELINEDNAANVDLFLNNLQKNFLSNYLFDKNSVFSLGYACENGKFNVALKIIEIGLREPEEVDLGEVDAAGRTPLMMCCSSDDEMSVIVVKELLKGNCRPDAEYNNKKTALMRACDYKEDASLLIVNELLNFNYKLGFQLDSSDESGIMYLFDYQNGNHKKDLLQNKLYIKVGVKYLKLYYTNKPNDKNFQDVMKKICNDQEVRRAFSTPLLKQGIDLNIYCREPELATEFAIGPPVAAIESAPKTLAINLPKAEELPSVFGERVEGVSPGGRWVSRADAQRYIRLYPPGKGPPGGGPAGGKKRKTIKRRSLKRNKKSRRQKR